MGKKQEIGTRIRTMRKSRKMTQEDLAKAIGQSASSITMYETGRREPDFETLEALADAFNVPFSSLVTKEEYSTSSMSANEQPKNDKIQLLIRGLNKLPPEQVDQALNVMKVVFAQYADYFEKGSDENDT